MVTEQDLRKYIAAELHNHVNDLEYQPIYEILVFEKPDSETVYPTGKHSGFPDMGATMSPGFYHSFQDAYDAIINNACDIWETCYDGAFLLCRLPGLYMPVASEGRMYFTYDHETRHYVQKEEPPIFNHYAL